MPLLFVRNDITKMKCDAIVCATDSALSGGGGVDRTIHAFAGTGLDEECRSLGGCETGSAKITKGYNLPCRYVIHAVGPFWNGGNSGEEELLCGAYRKSLSLALEYGCKSVAFPLLSCGAYGYPKEKAMQVALRCFSEFLLGHDMLIYLVFFDSESVSLGEKLFSNIEKYIDDNYSGLERIRAEKRRRGFAKSAGLPFSNFALPDLEEAAPLEKAAPFGKKAFGDFEPSPSLEHALSMVDESFSEMLLRKIDEKGLTDVQCYKKANIDRKLFSKIRGNPAYHPKKKTALAFAVALELSPEETDELLLKAGFSLTKSSKFDIIVEYFIKKGIYDIFTINEALFSFDQDLLGP